MHLAISLVEDLTADSSTATYRYLLWTEKYARLTEMEARLRYVPMPASVLHEADRMIVGEHTRHSSDYNRVKILHALLHMDGHAHDFSLRPESPPGGRVTEQMIVENMKRFREFLVSKIDKVISPSLERAEELVLLIRFVCIVSSQRNRT